MATKLVVGNWKMNGTIPSSAALLEAFLKDIDLAAKTAVDVVVCPAFLSIARIRELIRFAPVKLGAQDVFWAESGAFTGKVSASMLSDAGVEFCIVGHSETRGRFGKLETPASTLGFFAETDETVNLKLKALLYQSITPILCVGETAAEREAGQTEAIIERQVSNALVGIDPAELYTFVIAYEPVWAIGTGNTCSADEAQRICHLIRGHIESCCGTDVAEMVRVLYGGSVKASNAKELFAQADIDGGLVGGASLDPYEFAQIVLAA